MQQLVHCPCLIPTTLNGRPMLKGKEACAPCTCVCGATSWSQHLGPFVRKLRGCDLCGRSSCAHAHCDAVHAYRTHGQRMGDAGRKAGRGCGHARRTCNHLGVVSAPLASKSSKNPHSLVAHTHRYLCTCCAQCMHDTLCLWHHT